MRNALSSNLHAVTSHTIQEDSERFAFCFSRVCVGFVNATLWPTRTSFSRCTPMIISYKTPGVRSGRRSPGTSSNSLSGLLRTIVCPSLNLSARVPPGRKGEWSYFGCVLHTACVASAAILIHREDLLVGDQTTDARKRAKSRRALNLCALILSCEPCCSRDQPSRSGRCP
jgi:hypothetical protein